MVCTEQLPYLHAIELPTPFPVGPITVYLGDAPDEPLTLIDTGPRTGAARAALEAGLADLGHTPADLERIVITHAHVDHFGLAADLVATSGAEVVTHVWNLPALGDYDGERKRHAAFYGDLLRRAAVPGEMLTLVDGATDGMRRFAAPVSTGAGLDEGDRLRLGGRDWQVLHTPGHSAGLICLYEPAGRFLLSSDHLLADISSNPIVEPPPPGSAERLRSLVLYRASLERVAALAIREAWPGHGPVIYDVAGLVRRRLSFHKARLERVLAALGHGACTTWQITEALFPNRAPLDAFLAVSETIGHLDLLEMEGRISGDLDGGVVRWSLAPDTPADDCPSTGGRA